MQLRLDYSTGRQNTADFYFKSSAIALTIFSIGLLKAIAIIVSRDFYAISSTIYLLKAIAITMSRDF
jgi:hypothetical protein